jgi:hypothetical protein
MAPPYGIASATNLETREEFIALAHMWLKRAAKLESDLLEQQKKVATFR